MNHKMLPIVSAILILTVLLGTTPFTNAVTLRYTTAPSLLVTTIPQDNQVLEKGVIILGSYALKGRATCTYDPAVAALGVVPECGAADLMSQHKLIVT